VTHELYACRALPRAVFRGPGGHPTWRRHSLNRSTCQPGGSLLSPCASRCEAAHFPLRNMRRPGPPRRSRSRTPDDDHHHRPGPPGRMDDRWQ